MPIQIATVMIISTVGTSRWKEKKFNEMLFASLLKSKPHCDKYISSRGINPGRKDAVLQIQQVVYAGLHRQMRIELVASPKVYSVPGRHPVGGSISFVVLRIQQVVLNSLPSIKIAK